MPAIPMPTCAIPAGAYPIGSDELPNSRPRHTVRLAAFAIGETSVTNMHFAAFVAAGGYEDARYWTEMGWHWQESKKIQFPAFWGDQNFNHPLQPVVGVCWYEAAAFACWMASSSRFKWRLPSEAEWEAAARGPHGHAWPVGRAPDQRLTNTVELGLGRPWEAVDVGNVAWSGAHDLCGNVWEWCSSRWGHNWQTLEATYPYRADDGREDPTGSHARIIRGGSWFDPLREANPANRGRYLPGSRASNIGFRLAYTLPDED